MEGRKEDERKQKSGKVITRIKIMAKVEEGDMKISH
jgi:hypothetical protein